MARRSREASLHAAAVEEASSALGVKLTPFEDQMPLEDASPAKMKAWHAKKAEHNEKMLKQMLEAVKQTHPGGSSSASSGAGAAGSSATGQGLLKHGKRKVKEEDVNDFGNPTWRHIFAHAAVVMVACYGVSVLDTTSMKSKRKNLLVTVIKKIKGPNWLKDSGVDEVALFIAFKKKIQNNASYHRLAMHLLALT